MWLNYFYFLILPGIVCLIIWCVSWKYNWDPNQTIGVCGGVFGVVDLIVQIMRLWN